MEPVTILVTAMALGAAAGLKPTMEQAVKDAYAGLKKLIQQRYANVDVEQLEKDPTSDTRKKLLEEELSQTQAQHDQEVLQQAKQLLDIIQECAPATAKVIGVDLERIRGASLEVEEIISSHTGVRVSDSEFVGDVSIKKVRAGQGEQTQNPNP